MKPPPAPAARLAARLAAALFALRRTGRPAALAALDDDALRGQAAAVACMLQARAWTLRTGQPSWRRVYRAWAQAESDPALAERIAGPLPTRGRIEPIADGAAGFARREAMIDAARSTIDVASYYVQGDATGESLVAALARAAARGVRVRLLVDALMTFRKGREHPATEPLLARAAASGIAVRRWHDRRRPHDSNHRKMLVVDGRTALVGGRNVADHYRGSAWRDLDLVVEGPGVAPLARLFDQVWSGAPVEPVGHRPWIDTVPAAIESDPIVRFALSAIGRARERVELELAYLVAHPPLCDALGRAAARGVRVRVLSNSAESTDLPFATWTAHAAVRRLLDGGCAVRLRRGAGRTLHTKLLLVDGEWASFGSHNLDHYSPRWCCETNLIVRDRRLAAPLAAFFETGWTEATAATREEADHGLRHDRAQRLFDLAFRDFQ